MKVEEIKTVIIEAANKSSETRSNSKWTESLNKEFIKYAHNNGFSVYSKTKGSDWGEWLYDLTICKQLNKNSYILNTELVMESEWLPDDQSIIDDFQKLLLCNSHFKVMVFYKNQKMITELKKHIEEYDKVNGTFILACYTDDQGYIFEVVEK